MDGWMGNVRIRCSELTLGKDRIEERMKERKDGRKRFCKNELHLPRTLEIWESLLS